MNQRFLNAELYWEYVSIFWHYIQLVKRKCDKIGYMAILLQFWDSLVSATLNPSKENLGLLSDDEIQTFIVQSEKEQDNVRILMIDALVDKPKIRDKRQYVRINQAMLIRLLDKLYAYEHHKGLNEKILSLYNSIRRHLEETLNFIEDFFSNYFDRNEKVPTPYLTISLEELCRQLEKLKKCTKSHETVNPALINILVNNFNNFCKRKSNGVTYNELMYQKDLMSELLTDRTLNSEVLIKEVLFYFNFNDADFVAYTYQQLTALIEPLFSKAEKITALRYEQKNTNQSISKLSSHLSVYMPSLKEQVNQWIEEEIKFIEADQTIAKPNKSEQEPDEKIHTALSVAKVALLIRLMIIDKIITNRVVAHVLRIMIRTFTTLQKETISFGSIETKYHNPDRGTISAVKDMLFRWINILGKL